MEITKFNHSCIRVRSGERALLIDPGTFSTLAQAFTGVEAVLATHEHPDHLDVAALLVAMGANPELVFYGPPARAATVLEAAESFEAAGTGRILEASARIQAVSPGAHFEAAGLDISTHGGAHAVIHRSLPVVANLGFFIGGELFHPGDSYQVPEGIDVATLLIPAHAPWAKIGESLDFLEMVGAPLNIPIHDGLLNERGLSLVDGHLTRVAGEHGLEYRRIPNGIPVELDR
ncbi:MBL fold metallo-hydrolase [Paeniglutamicibacter gangotriensis]|uniref:Metallo-beta-lactamase superfamily protein n=1 Tax=Paeniglutamicibacter gangotriensis Lz1y TaxID=1276920 RepID=M7MTH5_9MICC|nr:MBL fold metallo-hydrolase [Paeniglutamicibacter gangotriensis]EMQ99717.1 Metallo-beta-lactamase superfamily protein [Paeniglutamicibacter gangotriensis Lz1y]